MRQVTRVNVDVASGERHVFGQLTLDSEVALKRVRVLEVLLHVQRERKHGTKARERLIVEALAAKLILRPRGNTRRHNSSRTDRRDWSTRRTNCSLKDLDRVEQ